VISIYPSVNETLVFTRSREEIYLLLIRAINNPVAHDGIPKTLKGWVEDDRFELTITLRRQHLFMPLVRGRIEQTSKGSLVFLEYVLFPGTRLLITFWTVIIPIVSVVIGYKYDHYWVVSSFLFFIVIMHWVARVNFNLHLASTKKILHEILD
jgi:hypothetical protein